MIELPLGLVDLGLGLQILRMLLDRQVGIAAELDQRHLRLLLQRSERLLRRLQSIARLIIGCARRIIVADERAGTIIGDLRQPDLGLLRPRYRSDALVILLSRLEGELQSSASCALAASSAIWNCVGSTRKKLVAGLDLLALMDIDRSHHPRDIRRDHQFRSLHIGIVGRNIAAAAEPEVAAGDDDGKECRRASGRRAGCVGPCRAGARRGSAGRRVAPEDVRAPLGRSGGSG